MCFRHTEAVILDNEHTRSPAETCDFLSDRSRCQTPGRGDEKKVIRCPQHLEEDQDVGRVQRLTLSISSTINSVSHNISKDLTSILTPLSATPHVKNPQDCTDKIKEIKMDQEMVSCCGTSLLPQKQSQQF